MLGEILAHLHNYFTDPSDIHAGTFTITDGSITLPFLQQGQYFRIVGSVFNDGVYQYTTDTLTDETFDGAVYAMRVPPDLHALATEITAWVEKYGDSPYVSESFGGYSCTKATQSSGAPVGWQTQFRGRLNRWRKV